MEAFFNTNRNILVCTADKRKERSITFVSSELNARPIAFGFSFVFQFVFEHCLQPTKRLLLS